MAADLKSLQEPLIIHLINSLSSINYLDYDFFIHIKNFNYPLRLTLKVKFTATSRIVFP